MSESVQETIGTSRNVAGAFRQRVRHGVPDYVMVASEMPLALSIDKLADALEAVTGERDKLAAFKTYVHKRLDDAGVTVDPESSHKAKGCRIGGRLDELIGERDKLRAIANVAYVGICDTLGWCRDASAPENWREMPRAVDSLIEAFAKAESLHTEASYVVACGWRDKFRAAEAENAKLRAAIKDAGFAVMETSGAWSIHDVSEKGKVDEARELEVATKNVTLEVENLKLRGVLAEANRVLGVYFLGGGLLSDDKARVASQINAALTGL